MVMVKVLSDNNGYNVLIDDVVVCGPKLGKNAQLVFSYYANERDILNAFDNTGKENDVLDKYCDLITGDNTEAIQYDSCKECYRYNICNTENRDE